MNKTRYFLAKLAIKYIYDDIASILADEESLRMWHKARRAGYKRSELGLYVQDLQNRDNMDAWDRI